MKPLSGISTDPVPSNLSASEGGRPSNFADTSVTKFGRTTSSRDCHLGPVGSTIISSTKFVCGERKVKTIDSLQRFTTLYL